MTRKDAGFCWRSSIWLEQKDSKSFHCRFDSCRQRLIVNSFFAERIIMITDIRSIQDKPRFQKVDVAWKEVERSSFSFTTDVDYQREHVWTKEQRESFIGYVLSGGECPPLWVNVRTISSEKSEVIDGKQRMTSSQMWLDGEICGRLPDGREVWYENLDKVSRRMMVLDCSFEIRLVELDRKGVLNLYLKLNSTGVPHTQDELDKVKALLDKEGTD